MAMALVVVPLLLMPLLGTPAALAQQPPGCRQTCGNITVPYPFGIGDGCYRETYFGVECDDASSPPRLTLLGFSNNRFASLSLAAGEASVYLNATRNCYDVHSGVFVSSNNETATFMEFPTIGANLPGYLFSAAKNWFVGLGCPNLSYFSDATGSYAGGCTSVCRPSGSALPSLGPCTGVGCCQTSISPGIGYYWPYQQVLEDKSSQQVFNSNITACRYSFLVDADWFRLHPMDIRRVDDFQVPVVLDWAIRNVGSCTAARRNLTDFACRGTHAECFDSTNGPGYICNCSKGYQGNPYLDGGCIDINECEQKDPSLCYGDCTNTLGSYTCQCPPGRSGDAYAMGGCHPDDKFTLALKVVTGVSVGVFLSLFTCFWTYMGLQKRNLIRAKQRFFEHNGGVLLQQQMRSYSVAGGGASGFKIFSTKELEKATDNFSAERILGRGGHGIVYKGVLEDGTVVAIKKSKMMEEAETKEFAREMLILSQINHRNVVKLLGCCLEVEVPMLVYEYVSNGTLYHYIHSSIEATFDTRLRIASESAEALAYMHSSASPPILHGDVKTANILLDEKLTAKVSDFGTSKLAPNDEVEIATLVQGTCGYLDPEYLMTCQLTDKSDVYSFGVVLLEILTRKKALYFDGPGENRSLVSSFMTALKVGRQDELLDQHVRSEMSTEAVEAITLLVMQCLSMIGQERPAMKEVAERLAVLRRCQQHPWTKADGDPKEEEQSLLCAQDILDLEGGTTYTFSM